MFNADTVFILGAGASCHYGYPTGEGLVKAVRDKAVALKTYIQNYDKSVTRDGYYSHNINNFQRKCPQYLIDMLNANNNDPSAVLFLAIKECDNLIEKIDRIDPPVIDHFLYYNEDSRALGKMLITWHLLEIESNRQTGVSGVDGRWLRYVYQHMMAGCKTPQDFLRNKVTFVTFNYDVSLERELFEAMSKTHFFQGTNVAERFFTEERFIHVYGKIRKRAYYPVPLVSQENSSVNEFANKFLLDLAYDASKDIKTIMYHDKLDCAEEIKSARQAIEAARYVYILGYGFDKINSNDILQLDTLLYEKEDTLHQKSVYFTNFGGSNVISKRAGKIFSKNQNMFLPPNGPIYDGHGTWHYEMSTKKVYDALQQDFEFFDD